MKKLTGFILALLLAINAFPLCGQAETSQALIQAVYQEKATELNIICAIPGEEGSEENFEITVGDSSLPILSVSTLQQENIPKTVYCLADVSGSMKGRMEKVQAVLNVVGNGLGENDNLVIGRLGNQISNSAFLENPEDISEEINSLEYTDDDTDLYNGIVQALNFLQQEEDVHTARFLIVLSDGYDRQDDGITWNEAYDAASKADIPIYTVAPILSSEDYEKAKDLGSFSRNSPGGIHFPKADASGSSPLPMEDEEIGAEILAAMGNTFLIHADLSGFQEPDRENYSVSVAFRDAEGKVYRDSKETKLSTGEEAPASTEEKNTVHETAPGSGTISGPSPQPQPDSGNGSPVFWIILGCVLAAAAVIAILLALNSRNRRRRRKQAEEGARQEAQAGSMGGGKDTLQETMCLAKEPSPEKLSWGTETSVGSGNKSLLPSLTIRLTALNAENKVYFAELTPGSEMTLGRNKNSKIVIAPEDRKLSSIHCTLFWDGEKVHIWDNQSTNGTSVNGVVINQLGRVAIVSGDTLRIGSYEYRLNWED